MQKLIINLSNICKLNVSQQIHDKKNEIDLKIVQKAGLKKFIKHNKIFSYAITSPKKFKYTVFDKIQ